MPVFHVANSCYHDAILTQGVAPYVLHCGERRFPNLSSRIHVYFWDKPEHAAWWRSRFCGYDYEIWECAEPSSREDDPHLFGAFRSRKTLKPVAQRQRDRDTGTSRIPPYGKRT